MMIFLLGNVNHKQGHRFVNESCLMMVEVFMIWDMQVDFCEYVCNLHLKNNLMILCLVLKVLFMVIGMLFDYCIC
jgi:hypothetical protein